MTTRVVVLDYGSGNLRSAERALARVGADASVTADPDGALECDGLVVPGVGAFAACMAGLRSVGGDKLIARRIELGRPVLGICVGMQVLFAAGVEHGLRTPGCGVWPGTIERLDATVLPHMGWNTVTVAEGSALFNGIPAGTRFYFVHSYALRMAARGAWGEWGGRRPLPRGVRGDGSAQGEQQGGSGGDRSPGGNTAKITVTEHGEPFAAAVELGVVSATQFHPEKSGDAGAVVLSNWLETL